MRRRGLWVLMLLLGLSLAGPARAEPSAEVQQLIDATVVAFGNGDLAAALEASGAAVALARAQDAPDPVQFAFALNNLAYALVQTGGDPGRARSLLDEAMAGLEAGGLRASQAWLTAADNLAALLVQVGEGDAARARVTETMRVGRETAFYPRVAAAASARHFQLGDYPQAVAYLREVLAVDKSVVAPGLGAIYDAYFAANETAEADGRVRDSVALIEGRIALHRAFPQDGSAEVIRSLLFQKYYALYNAGHYGEAADALRVWATTGTPDAGQRDFIDSMASLSLEFAQLASYSTGRAAQLGLAELAVVFSEALGEPQDPRLGHALRERAAAEAALGRFDAADEALGRAAEVLAATAEGRAALHLVLADLAANAWQQNRLELAQALYDRAAVAYAAALTAGAAPLSRMDLVIDAVNRANLHIDMAAPAEALALLEVAAEDFAAAEAEGGLKWNGRTEGARIDAVAARALSDLGKGPEAVARMRRAVAGARAAFPDGHPGLALTLANAGDLLAVEGEHAAAVALVAEAAAIQATALPPGDPEALDTLAKLVTFHLLDGDRAAALTTLRQVARARQLPANRQGLADAAFDFEMLAWLLLEGPAPGPAAIDEAFAALQWTQVSRSAAAVEMMEARLALAEAGLGTLLRQRQDLREAYRRAKSELLAAYAAGAAATGATVRAVNRQLAGIGADLARIDGDLAAAGLDPADLGQITPLSVAEVQALLAPGDALISFALPGLASGPISGLEGSSNRLIVITPDAVAVTAVTEASRGALVRRIRAFRCAVAVSDPGCAGGGAAGLRGAMLLDPEPDPQAYLDLGPARALYDDLFGGAEAALAGATHLILVPPADLLDLPFQALVTGEGARDGLRDVPWLIRSQAISILPSVSGLRVLRSAVGTRAGRLLGVGDPEIGLGGPMDCGAMKLAALRSAATIAPHMQAGPDPSGLRLADPAALRLLARLPDSACELQAIAAQFAAGDSTLLLGAAAREAEVKRLNAEGALREFDVLVFATHGLVAGEAGAAAPGLVLTPPALATAEDDGLLTAAEVATLDLDAQLVVLSACNTAAGEGQDAEGLSGLTRAFLHAGARSVMVTQWAVYSEAAVEVSSGLFRARGQRGLEGAAALRAAVLPLLDGSDSFKRHPAYWAPFTMVGAI